MTKARTARPGRGGAAALLLLLLTACGGPATGGATPSGTAAAPRSAPTSAPGPAPVSATPTAAPTPAKDNWWRVPALLHLAPATDSTKHSDRYQAEYLLENPDDPPRDVKHVFDLTSLRGRVEIGSLGEGLNCTRQGYVVTCPELSRKSSGMPFWLRAVPGASVGEAGRIDLAIHQKSGPPLRRTTRVVIGSPVFLKAPVKQSPDLNSGSPVALNPEFAYRGDLSVTGVTVQLELTGADFAGRHSNCRYEQGGTAEAGAPTPTVAECDFDTTVTDGRTYRLPEPLRAALATGAKDSGALPATSGTLTYSAWPTGAPDARQGLRPDAPRGEGPALRLEEAAGGSGPAELTEKYRGGLEFGITPGKEVAGAAPDYEAPPLVIKGRLGEKVSVQVPAALLHKGGHTTTTHRELLLTLPEGVTPLPQRGEDLPSEDTFCGDRGPQKVQCHLDIYGNPGFLEARIDRLVPGATGRVDFVPGEAGGDGNPSNDHAPITVEITG